MRLEISTAGSDLENLASVVFRNGVVAVRASRAGITIRNTLFMESSKQPRLAAV
jgi:hypothetical protein